MHVDVRHKRLCLTQKPFLRTSSFRVSHAFTQLSYPDEGTLTLLTNTALCCDLVLHALQGAVTSEGKLTSAPATAVQSGISM